MRPRPAFREDLDLHVAVSRLKLKFMGSSGGADPWRPPHRIDHGDGKRDARDRSRVRVLRTDGIRYRRHHRQSPDELSGIRRPRALAGRAAGVRGMGAGNDRRRMDGICPKIRRAVAHRGQWRRLSADAVRRRERRGAARSRTAGLYGAAVPGHGRVFGGEDHPPHSRPRAQYRFRVDRRSAGAGDLRGTKPAPRPRHDGGYAVLPHDRRRDQGRARVARLAAGFCGRGQAIRPSWPATSAHRR